MEVIKWTGGKIDHEGVYDLPIDIHHSDCCSGPSVSSSGLRTIELQSPLHFYDSSYLNPNRDTEAPKALEADHFRLGRAAHMLMLEPHLFRGAIAVRPEKFKDWRTDASQAWRDQQQAIGKTILTPKELQQANGVASALKAHPLHEQGILSGPSELSMIVRDRKTGIWLKSRPDSIPLDNAFSDLKVMNDASPPSVGRAIRELGYDMQMALAGVCLFNLTLGQDPPRTVDQFWIVAVESKRPHAIHVASLSVAAVYWARIKLRHAIDTLAKCLADNDWPSYGMDGAEAGPSQREQETLVQLQKNALLPQEDDF